MKEKSHDEKEVFSGFEVTEESQKTAPKKEEKALEKKQLLWVVLSSILIGLLNGFFGGGGGMVCVPILQKVLHVETKKAHATTICVIAALSIVSSAFYIARNNLEISKILFTAIGVFFGGFLGAFLLFRLKAKYVRFIFAILMLIAGIQMLI